MNVDTSNALNMTAMSTINGLNAKADHSVAQMKSFAEALKNAANNPANNKDGTETPEAISKAEALNEEKIRRTAREFEAMFISQMLAPMFENIDPDPVFGGGQGEDMFKGMLIEEYGKTIAEQGGLGLEDVIRAQLETYQKEMTQ